MGVWHTYSTRQTLSELETDKSRGLSGAEAERRLARWGPNRLEEGRRQGLLLRFLGQMKDPMILVLLGAAVASGLTGLTMEEVEQAVEKRVPEKFKEMNLKALKLGALAYGRSR